MKDFAATQDPARHDTVVQAVVMEAYKRHQEPPDPSAIPRSARPCVEAQLRHRFGPDAVQKESEFNEPVHPAHFPTLLAERLPVAVMEPGGASAVVYDGMLGPHFHVAKENTPEALSTHEVLGGPEEVDLQ